MSLKIALFYRAHMSSY